MESSVIIGKSSHSTIYLLPSGQVRKDIDFDKREASLCLFELEILQSLRHPYLLNGEGFTFTDDTISIFLPQAAFDMIEGYDHDFPLDMLTTFFYQASLGLAALHRNNILHLDIKPDNIFVFYVEGRPVARLADFGYARDWSIMKGRFVNPLGTPVYLPPEVLEAVVDQEKIYLQPEIDIWALGLSFLLVMGREASYYSTECLSLSFADLASRAKKQWLDDNQKNKYLSSLFNDPILVEVFGNMLTHAPRRWAIDTIVERLAKLLPSQQVISTTDLPPANDLDPEIEKKVILIASRLSGTVEQRILFWFRRLVSRLGRDRLDDVEIVVLIYIILGFSGKSISTASYFQEARISLSFSRFKQVEMDLLEEIYPKPSQL
jgi:serine/threonine protein kinase